MHTVFTGLVVLLALVLRTCGLSHDLDEGKIYHPDTPKQMRAAERFSQGVFFHETGRRNYDGYPYFTSLVVAGLYRAGGACLAALANHLGFRPPLFTDSVFVFFWITRFFNALISTLAVWVFTRLARQRVRPLPAYAAALCLALNPFDIIACHYASGETLAAFLALLALRHSLRVAESGRITDYIWASLYSVVAFSAKYHAGLVALCLFAAHIIRMGWAGVFTRSASWKRVGVAAVTAVVAFVLTTPGLWVNAPRTLAHVLAFLQKAHAFGRTETVFGFTGPVRRLFGLWVNLPVFWEGLSPTLFGAACVGIVVAFARRDSMRMLLAVLPVAYGVVGFSSKTAENPVYHTLVTPALTLLGVWTLADVARIRQVQPWARSAACLLLGATFFWLGNAAWREAFFFQHEDTRLLLEHWLKENVPSSLPIRTGRRAYLPWAVRSEAPNASPVCVRCDPRTLVPTNFFLLHRLAIEERSLAPFRNATAEVFVGPKAGIAPDWALPAYQKIPSAFGSVLVLAESPDFIRSAKLFDVEPGKTVRKTLASRNALDELLVRVQAHAYPTRVEVVVGRWRRAWTLASDQTGWAVVSKPACRGPRIPGLRLYAVSARATGGTARIQLAVTAEERALALFQSGAYAEALCRLPDAETPLRAAVQTLAREMVGLPATNVPGEARLTSKPDSAADASDPLARYGLSSAYIRALPYLQWSAESLETEGFRCDLLPDEAVGTLLLPVATDRPWRRIATPPVFLPGGAYCAELERLDSCWHPGHPEGIRLRVEDAVGHLVAEGVASHSRSGKTDVRNVLAFQKPAYPAVVRLVLDIPSAFEPRVRGLSLRPDLAVSARAWEALAAGIRENRSLLDAAWPAHYELLLDLARAWEKRCAFSKAAAAYGAASRACPTRLEALDGLAGLPSEACAALPDDVQDQLAERKRTAAARTRRPLDTRFAKGFRLTGWALTHESARPGEKVGLRLFWDVSGVRRRFDDVAVWVHFMAPDGRRAFQGDHGLRAGLTAPATASFLGLQDYTWITVPSNAVPGIYGIRVGLYVPRYRIRFSATSGRDTVVGSGVRIGRLMIDSSAVETGASCLAPLGDTAIK